MADFWTADLHLGHEMILFHAKRPFKDVDEMDQAIIDNWNSVVKKGDTVRILGDVAFGNHKNYMKKLNGNKILFIGSHDDMSVDDYLAFKDIKTADFVKINGKWYYCSHTPHRTWDRGHYGVPHLFGHHHGRMKTFNMSFDVGIDTDLAGFYPIPADAVDKEVERRRLVMHACGRIKVEKKSNGTEKVLYEQDDVMYWLNKFNQSSPKKANVSEMQARFLPDNYITQKDGKFICWDETKSDVVAVKDTIEDARMVLHEYACTLEPIGPEVDTEL